MLTFGKLKRSRIRQSDPAPYDTLDENEKIISIEQFFGSCSHPVVEMRAGNGLPFLQALPNDTFFLMEVVTDAKVLADEASSASSWQCTVPGLCVAQVPSVASVPPPHKAGARLEQNYGSLRYRMRRRVQGRLCATPGGRRVAQGSRVARAQGWPPPPPPCQGKAVRALGAVWAERDARPSCDKKARLVAQ